MCIRIKVICNNDNIETLALIINKSKIDISNELEKNDTCVLFLKSFEDDDEIEAEAYVNHIYEKYGISCFITE